MIRCATLAIASLVLIGASVLHPATSAANNARCWGHGTDDLERGDISCTKLTEPFLMSMRGRTLPEVRKAMDARGRETPSLLHFLGNFDYGRSEGAGIVNFAFKGGRVAVITASVDHALGAGSPMEFIWNVDASGAPFCSDFPGSKARCSD